MTPQERKAFEAMREALCTIEPISARLVGAAFSGCEGRHFQNGACLYCDHVAILDKARAALALAEGVKP